MLTSAHITQGQADGVGGAGCGPRSVHAGRRAAVLPAEAHGPVDQVEHQEHDREHHEEHIVHLRPEEGSILIIGVFEGVARGLKGKSCIVYTKPSYLG